MEAILDRTGRACNPELPSLPALYRMRRWPERTCTRMCNHDLALASHIRWSLESAKAASPPIIARTAIYRQLGRQRACEGKKKTKQKTAWAAGVIAAAAKPWRRTAGKANDPTTSSIIERASESSSVAGGFWRVVEKQASPIFGPNWYRGVQRRRIQLKLENLRGPVLNGFDGVQFGCRVGVGVGSDWSRGCTGGSSGVASIARNHVTTPFLGGCFVVF